MKIESNVPLAKYTSWLIGGNAEYFCLPQTEMEVQEAQSWAQSKGLEFLVLGGGSNVLVSDRGVKGLVCCLRRFSSVLAEVRNEKLFLTVKAGTAKSEILKVLLKYKLPSALFMAGLPGDVGGGIVMNAGVGESIVPREFGEIVEWFEVLKPTGEVKRYLHDEVEWSYRHSRGWQPGIILTVGLVTPLSAEPEILEKVKQANRTRLSKQPLDMPSCGSVFRNPPNFKAAQLIEQCGLKGLRRGDAQVSTKHANFIVNLEQATAKDTWDLILNVQSEVQKQKGIQLQTEVVRVGDWSKE